MLISIISQIAFIVGFFMTTIKLIAKYDRLTKRPRQLLIAAAYMWLVAGGLTFNLPLPILGLAGWILCKYTLNQH